MPKLSANISYQYNFLQRTVRTIFLGFQQFIELIIGTE